MARDELAPGLRVLQGAPGWLLNCYVLGDVLLDSGMWFSGRRILRQLRHSDVTGHALSHAHGDHAGSSHAVLASLGVPLWVGAGDAAAVAAGQFATHGNRAANAVLRALAPARSCAVDRALHEGDVVGGFTVLEVPGHSPGALAFWREADRVLICGDVFANVSSRRSRVRELPALLSHDAQASHASALRLATLRPALACFGHGPPVRDPGLFAEALAHTRSARH